MGYLPATGILTADEAAAFAARIAALDMSDAYGLRTDTGREGASAVLCPDCRTPVSATVQPLRTTPRTTGAVARQRSAEVPGR